MTFRTRGRGGGERVGEKGVVRGVVRGVERGVEREKACACALFALFALCA